SSARLQKALAELFGYSHAILFGRARSGITTLLETLSHGNTPVILPSNICPAVLTSIVGSGCKPLLAPVSIGNGLPEDSTIAALIMESTQKGVAMITHLYGFHKTYPLTLRAAN